MHQSLVAIRARADGQRNSAPATASPAPAMAARIPNSRRQFQQASTGFSR